MCASRVKVSCDAGCALVHKPTRYDDGAKVFGVGFKKTGTTTLQAAFGKLSLEPSCLGEMRVAGVEVLLVGRLLERDYSGLFDQYGFRSLRKF